MVTPPWKIFNYWSFAEQRAEAHFCARRLSGLQEKERASAHTQWDYMRTCVNIWKSDCRSALSGLSSCIVLNMWYWKRVVICAHTVHIRWFIQVTEDEDVPRIICTFWPRFDSQEMDKTTEMPWTQYNLRLKLLTVNKHTLLIALQFYSMRLIVDSAVPVWGPGLGIVKY